MARTKASAGAKVTSGKSFKARCTVPPASNTSSGSGASDRGSKSSGGGNPVCPRETPKWQRPISTFFVTKPSQKPVNGEEESAGSSKPKPKPRRNIIESDDEEERPKNKELDETIELEPLTGENNHKLEEFYTKDSEKGKGVGKKSKNKGTEKENVDLNIEEDKSSDKDIVNNNSKSKKRVRDDSFEENVTKKVKV